MDAKAYPMVSVFMTDDGPIRIDEMDREGLIAVIEYLGREVEKSREQARVRAHRLKREFGWAKITA